MILHNLFERKKVFQGTDSRVNNFQEWLYNDSINGKHGFLCLRNKLLFFIVYLHKRLWCLECLLFTITGCCLQRLLMKQRHSWTSMLCLYTVVLMVKELAGNASSSVVTSISSQTSASHDIIQQSFTSSLYSEVMITMGEKAITILGQHAVLHRSASTLLFPHAPSSPSWSFICSVGLNII